METEELVLRQSRGKTALVILGSAIFVCAGVWMITSPGGSSRYSPEFTTLIGWLGVVFFGGVALLSLYRIAEPAKLVLSAKGFQIFGVLRHPLVDWRDVERFFVAEVRKSRFVCYDLKPESKSRYPRRMELQLGQWGDGQAPAYLEIGVDDVFRVLEEWRARHAP